MSMNAKAEKRYFEETARALRHEGFQVDGQLGDQSLYVVTKTGGITYRNENIAAQTAWLQRAKSMASPALSRNICGQTEQAQPMPVGDLKDRYKVLADFNGAVLARAFSKHGVEFVTWEWEFNHEGVSQGHYYNMNYSAAKQDFAIRSALYRNSGFSGTNSSWRSTVVAPISCFCVKSACIL